MQPTKAIGLLPRGQHHLRFGTININQHCFEQQKRCNTRNISMQKPSIACSKNKFNLQVLRSTNLDMTSSFQCMDSLAISTVDSDVSAETNVLSPRCRFTLSTTFTRNVYNQCEYNISEDVIQLLCNGQYQLENTLTLNSQGTALPNVCHFVITTVIETRGKPYTNNSNQIKHIINSSSPPDLRTHTH